MNYMADIGVSYSRKKLNYDQISYLKRLPFQVILKESGIALSHGSFANPEEWNYIFEKEDVFSDYYALNGTFPEWKISFIGHTHYPVVLCNEDNKVKAISSGFNKSSYTIGLKTTRKYIINVGSVGQPRDTCPLSCYVILETKGKYHNITFRRVEYNIEAACAAIDEVELPSSLSERLKNGK
jgi:diadenosine tetraphosphatase ApaH/serine/threonine PP2A family protein phosphatase